MATALLMVVGSGLGADTQVPATVTRCYDGDTCTVEARPWPWVHLGRECARGGVDTPEIRGKCDAEKALAIEARDFVRAMIVGAEIELVDPEWGLYAGRVVACVMIEGGHDLADHLIDLSLA